MAITPELDDRIEKEMAALTPVQYLRAGMAYNKFVKELTGLIAQAKEDKDQMSKSKFDTAELPYYYACLEKLALEHAHRHTAEKTEEKVIQEFKDGMPVAEHNKKILMGMGRCVIREKNDKEAIHIYKYVRKGRGYVDTLNDNITMSQFGMRFLETASKVSPDGQDITEEYLTRVEKEAVNMLKLVGLADAASDETKEEVDRLHRIVTLCVKVRSDIKFYAEMAFMSDPDHYSEHYASETFRSLRKEKDDIEESEIEDVIVEDVPESDNPEEQPV